MKNHRSGRTVPKTWLFGAIAAAGLLAGGPTAAQVPAGPGQETTPQAQAPAPSTTAPAPPTTPSGAPTAPSGAPTTTGRILGRVTDAGKPVQGAQVRLLSRSESGLLRVTSSDQRGEYRFKELPTGTYDVEVEADGFRLSAKAGVEVRAPFQNIVDVPMMREGSQTAKAAPPVAGAPGQGIPGAPAPNAEPAVPPVTVQGVLVNGDRRPVVDVSVLLVALQGTKLYQATSGNDGVFVIGGVVPGRYRAVVRSPGHMPVDLKSVEVKPEAGLTLNLSLVDFPLNFKSRAEASPPPETPRQLPGMAPVPASVPVDLPPGSSRPTPPPAIPTTIEGSQKPAPDGASAPEKPPDNAKPPQPPKPPAEGAKPPAEGAKPPAEKAKPSGGGTGS